MTTTNTNGTEAAPRAKQARGFASMDPAKQRKIASKGGKRAHAIGRAHEWTVKEAREAGRKGGLAARVKTEAVPASSPVTETDTEGSER